VAKILEEMTAEEVIDSFLDEAEELWRIVEVRGFGDVAFRKGLARFKARATQARNGLKRAAEAEQPKKKKEKEVIMVIDEETGEPRPGTPEEIRAALTEIGGAGQGSQQVDASFDGGEDWI